MLLPNPNGQFPKISNKAWVFETALIIGNVTIEENVFVGPNAVLRADEPGSSIVIRSGCNVQDNVVVHSLSDSEVRIGNNTSLAHGCIVHGPCKIGESCFIGFGTVVFDCNIGKDTVVFHRSIVRGVEILPHKVVPDGAAITSQKAASALEDITADLAEFKKSVVRANIDLVEGYKDLPHEDETAPLSILQESDTGKAQDLESPE
ncbi:carbonate dehydratase [Methanosarcina sp. Z-7115]|uniref:Carbonate dehydratase n=1 Tax=Methanosarcina baikalica TaxID=3073890 RepID=A0ABU2CZH3_9EURY|nr:carbonate dehydratase [Methanosarcina sp. Z-7115]MDR7664992.1 carbonate dehydratase [Methanosarcina sp. Z-7115]